MGIVRFALRFPHTFYVVAALILFLGIVACREMRTERLPPCRREQSANAAGGADLVILPEVP